MPKVKDWTEAQNRHRDRIAKALEHTRAAREHRINPWAVATQEEKDAIHPDNTGDRK